MVPAMPIPEASLMSEKHLVLGARAGMWPWDRHLAPDSYFLKNSGISRGDSPDFLWFSNATILLSLSWTVLHFIHCPTSLGFHWKSVFIRIDPGCWWSSSFFPKRAQASQRVREGTCSGPPCRHRFCFFLIPIYCQVCRVWLTTKEILGDVGGVGSEIFLELRGFIGLTSRKRCFLLQWQ